MKDVERGTAAVQPRDVRRLHGEQPRVWIGIAPVVIGAVELGGGLDACRRTQPTRRRRIPGGTWRDLEW